MEHHGFSGDSRAEGHGAADLAGASALDQFVQDKHDGRGGHVAEVEENTARVGERLGRESEPLLSGVEDGAAAGMNGPEIDRREFASSSDSCARFGEPIAQLDWDLAGEMHVKSLFADAPGDELIGAGEVDGEKAVEGEADGLGGDEIGGAAIGKDREGEQLLEILGLLHVQGAELEREEQDFGAGFGANDVAGGLERIDGGIAAHEADEGALDGGVKVEKLDDFVVEAGRVEAGAAGHDDVGNALAFGVGECELQECATRELRSELPKGLHAPRSGGEVAAHEESVCILH